MDLITLRTRAAFAATGATILVPDFEPNPPSIVTFIGAQEQNSVFTIIREAESLSLESVDHIDNSRKVDLRGLVHVYLIIPC